MSVTETVSCSLVRQWDIGATLGECVTWDDRLSRFYWTDIEGSCLYIFEWGAPEPVRYQLPHRLASFGLTQNPNVLLAAFDYGLGWLDLTSFEIVPIVQIESERPNTRLNDGRMDRQGRFWFGTMANDVRPDTIGEGRLYCFDGESNPMIHREGILIPNSLAWSPNGETMYFADSKTFRIDAYNFDTANGRPTDRRTLSSVPAGFHADGSCVDADGYLWNAQWGGSRIIRYAPDGTEDFCLPLPTFEPTCVGLGGPDLDHLCIATANLDPESSGTGSVYLYKTSIRGLIEPRFNKMPLT